MSLILNFFVPLLNGSSEKMLLYDPEVLALFSYVSSQDKKPSNLPKALSRFNAKPRKPRSLMPCKMVPNSLILSPAKNQYRQSNTSGSYSNIFSEEPFSKGTKKFKIKLISGNVTNCMWIGFSNNNSTSYNGTTAYGMWVYGNYLSIASNSTSTTFTTTTPRLGDTLTMVLNCDTNTITWYVNDQLGATHSSVSLPLYFVISLSYDMTVELLSS